MEELNWGDRPVTALPGVGRVKAGHFGKLGIQTIADLLYHFPRGYQNRGTVCLLGEASMTPCSTSTILTVGSKPSSVRLKGNRVMTRFTAFDDSGKCIITFFNQPYVKDIFFLGSSFRFWGKGEKLGRNFTLSCPEYEPFDGVHPLPEFKSVYPLTEGLNQKGVGSAVALALQDADKIKDPLPPDVLQSYCLLPFGEAFRSDAAFKKACSFISAREFCGKIPPARKLVGNMSQPTMPGTYALCHFNSFIKGKV